MFYPGTIWAKRIRHLIVLCGIGTNLIINTIENQVLRLGENMIEQAEMLSNPATSTAYVLEHSIVPAISYMESTRFSGVLERFGVPSSEGIKAQIDNTYALKATLETYGPRYRDFALILQVINIIFWITIGLSALWILIDLVKGKQKSFIVVCLLLTALFNVASFHYLYAFFLV